MRERDAAALDTLARLLELGVNPHPHERFVTEPWHEILRRYGAGRYPRADKTIENEQMARHFWLRQVVHRETLVISSEKVAVAWRFHDQVVHKTARTVLSEANRKEARRSARSWIASRFRQYRTEHTRDSIAWALLKRFEPEGKLE